MSDFPKPAPIPERNDTVQVLMPEFLAREFEQRVLGQLKLSPALLFSDDDCPTYIIET